MGQQWPAAGSGALSEVVHALDLLKEVAIIFITSTIVWAPKSLQMVTAAMKLKDAYSLEGKL